MKYFFVILLTMFIVASFCCEVTPFGPEADDVTYANLAQEPISFGGTANGQNDLFVWEGGTWNFYPFWATGLPATSIWNLDETTIMVAMGAGSYSDGVYNFDLNTHTWTINEWFMFPNFLVYNPGNGIYYVGERDGLFRSADANSWTRITSLGTNKCSSLAFYNSNMVTNNGALVKYSTDNGLTWQTGNTSNLRGFRYTENGVLYAIMDVESDSDGLWRSDDYGETWDNVLFTSNLNCIGPDFGEYIILGWRQANEEDGYLAVLDSQSQLTQLVHASLDSEVRQLEIFPLINTPSFYVINGEGCFYITGFLPVNNDDATAPVIDGIKLQAYPNPFSRETTIEVKVKDMAAALKVDVYNLKGQLIKRLSNDNRQTQNTFSWDGRDFNNQLVGSGFYFVKAELNGKINCCKVLLIH